jgi:serine phosphatase RsbU (regulator of sigma subunit)
MRKVSLILAITLVISFAGFRFASALNSSLASYISYIAIVGAPLQGQAKIDSLMTELHKMKEDTNRVNLLLDIAVEYIYINPDDGIKFCEKAINLSSKLSWRSGEAKCFYNLAIVYSNGKYDYFKALEIYNKALQIYRQIGDDYGIGGNLTSIGNLYGRLSDYTKALEYFFEALKIYEKKEYKFGIAMNYANIGNIYQSQIGINHQQRSKNINQSLDYYYKAIKILSEIGAKNAVAQVYGNIATIYHDDSNIGKALENYKKVLHYYEEFGDQYEIARNLGNIGNLYADTKEYAKAFDYYKNAMKINEQLGYKDNLANNYANIGKLYSEISIDSVKNFISQYSPYISNESNINLERALQYLTKSIAIFEELGNKHSQYYFLNELSIVYERMGKYQASLDAFRQYTLIKDSLQTSDIEVKIDNMEKSNEIERLNSEQRKQELEMYLLTGGILVLIAALVFSYLRYKEKKMLSEKLIRKNIVIEEQKQLVEEQNEHIYSSIRYASTIQHALMPWDSTLKKAFNDYFIFFKPKDIVSGDFYWFQEDEGVKFLAVIDCTGHGIPGSMLTVIASDILDDAVLSKRLTDTGKILTYINQKVTEVLNQRLAENKIRDGMEVALIAIHHDKIQFSGAGRPLYIKNDTMEIIKTDKRGIAGQTDNDEYQFSSIEIEKSENLMLYLTSDGFADQMNEQSKKYSTKRFVALLDSISEQPISEQKEILENEFNSHKGERSQIDDVTILGVRI